MKKTPQHETVLRMLREAGSRGVHSSDIYRVFITNPSERIRKLESLGALIDHSDERPAPDRAMGTRYVLTRDIPAASRVTTASERPTGATPTSSAPAVPALFPEDPIVRAGLGAINDNWDQEAA